MEEPDGMSTEIPRMPKGSLGEDQGLPGGLDAIQQEQLAAAATDGAGDVVLKVMRALRDLDEPYPLHGCEVAIRYCSPTNRASRLTPQSFAQYLSEPWYQILTEWDEIELDEDPGEGDDSSSVSQDVYVKREEDDSWTVVNWMLSKHSGRWLMDAMTLN